MFEVIISNINTGRVTRKLLGSRELADRYVEDFMSGGAFPRTPRNYRVEIHLRDLPVVRPLSAGTASHARKSAMTIPAA
jgi:hypothetical protein